MKINLKKTLIVTSIVTVTAAAGILTIKFCYQAPKIDEFLKYDLVQNYTESDYENGINEYNKKVDEATPEQMINEVTNITNTLLIECALAYKGLNPYFRNLFSVKLAEEDAKNIYNFFSRKVSKSFYPSYEVFTNFAIQNEKNPEFVYTYKSIAQMQIFTFCKTEFSINKLIILFNKILEKKYFDNNDSFDNWAEKDKNKIANLLLQLTCWLNCNVLYWKHDDFVVKMLKDEKNIKIKNINFFGEYIKQFKANAQKLKNKYEISNNDLSLNLNSPQDGLAISQTDKGFYNFFPIPSKTPKIALINQNSNINSKS